MGKAKTNLPVGIPVGANLVEPVAELKNETELKSSESPKLGFSDNGIVEDSNHYTIETVSIDVPVVRGLHGYATTRVDAMLTQRQAIELRAITAGLRHRGATLLDGRPVDRPSHTVQWLLEQHIRDSDDIRRGDGRSG